MLCVPACLGARVFSMFACFMSLRAHKSYMLAVLKYLTCLRAWYPRLTDVWQGVNALPRGNSKSISLTKGEGSSRKKCDEEWHRKWVWCQKIFAAHFFGDTIFAPSYLSNSSNNITVSNNKKYPKDYMCLWDPKHHNSTILRKWLVNTCASMWKGECTHRL